MDPLIVTASLCGRERFKKDSPYFPATTDEVIAEGISSFKAGVPQLHIHARDKTGNYTYDPQIFGGILDVFRSTCPNVILQISAGGTYQKEEELLIPILKLKADVTTLALQPAKEKNIALIKLFDTYGTHPIVECFSLENIKTACQLFDEGYLKAPLRIEILFEEDSKGRTFSELAGELLEGAGICSSHKEIVWSCCRGDNHQIPLHAMAIALGGHVRAGLEDRIKDNDGQYYRSCLEELAPEMNLSVKMGRKLANVPQARKILGLE
ncbi:MAG: 3-keto-5-aminohexanoate cleavage protein [Spirochaetales bacterium]|nr:3-keto-5-aminohexanoate cleavage protein [Spirochaetales bacterium]